MTTMTSPVFSIIIPHYSIPGLLLRCVASIPQRPDVEIIVVDDCSPDTPELQAAFATLRQRSGLHILRTPQGGSAGRARNVGLDAARGTWILFADADDFFDEHLAAFMDKVARAPEDVVYFNFRSVLSDDVSQPSEREAAYADFFRQYARDHREDNFRFLYQTPWGKLIRRSLVERHHIRFDETRYANDAMFAVRVGCEAGRIRVADVPLYVLTERSGSLADQFCRKPGETLVRAQVALCVRQTIAAHGYAFDYDWQMFIRLLIWNGEFGDLLHLYHTISRYGLRRRDILHTVRQTGRRFLPLCLWLPAADAGLTLLRK